MHLVFPQANCKRKSIEEPQESAQRKVSSKKQKKEPIVVELPTQHLASGKYETEMVDLLQKPCHRAQRGQCPGSKPSESSRRWQALTGESPKVAEPSVVIRSVDRRTPQQIQALIQWASEPVPHPDLSFFKAHQKSEENPDVDPHGPEAQPKPSLTLQEQLDCNHKDTVAFTNVIALLLQNQQPQAPFAYTPPHPLQSSQHLLVQGDGDSMASGSDSHNSHNFHSPFDDAWAALSQPLAPPSLPLAKVDPMSSLSFSAPTISGIPQAIEVQPPQILKLGTVTVRFLESERETLWRKTSPSYYPAGMMAGPNGMIPNGSKTISQNFRMWMAEAHDQFPCGSYQKKVEQSREHCPVLASPVQQRRAEDGSLLAGICQQWSAHESSQITWVVSYIMGGNYSPGVKYHLRRSPITSNLARHCYIHALYLALPIVPPSAFRSSGTY
ncbi:hypothetical protein C8J57DRAFT_1220919 [Mycena rebaudengoi]|nr:hypothetical protein C8J57DRAFT_1220919 [Mycena rebaudengoi]